METIFDHNVSEEEMKDLFGMVIIESEYLDGLEQRKAYEHLFYLYRKRGDKRTAMKYLNKTPDDKHKFFEVLNSDWSGYKYFKEGF